MPMSLEPVLSDASRSKARLTLSKSGDSALRPKSFKIRPFVFNILQAQFRPTPLLSSVCAFPGGWGASPITGAASRPSTSRASDRLCAWFGNKLFAFGRSPNFTPKAIRVAGKLPLLRKPNPKFSESVREGISRLDSRSSSLPNLRDLRVPTATHMLYFFSEDE